jgi:hypothetical protein
VAPPLQFSVGMRFKSLLVTLGILGSSSLALADHGYNTNPYQQRRIETTWRDRQPARFQQPAYRPDYRNDNRSYGYDQRYTTWQPLTALERLDRGGDLFDLSTRGRFTQLRLQNQSGRTLVRQIEIVFANGERQIVHCGRALEGNHAMIDVDLDGDARRIDKIFVDGRSGRDGSYQLYAM